MLSCLFARQWCRSCVSNHAELAPCNQIKTAFTFTPCCISKDRRFYALLLSVTHPDPILRSLPEGPHTLMIRCDRPVSAPVAKALYMAASMICPRAWWLPT